MSGTKIPPPYLKLFVVAAFEGGDFGDTGLVNVFADFGDELEVAKLEGYLQAIPG